MRVIIFLCVFSVSLVQSGTPADWGKDLFKNPGKYFSNNYEKSLFIGFKKKFKNVSIENIIKEDRRSILHLKLKSSSEYLLVCELDKNLKIKRIFRQLKFLSDMDRSIIDKIIIQWLGKFFYHLDAGNKEAMYDLVFHKETKILYKNLSDKKDIIKQLLKDFPAAINPQQLKIEAVDSKYRVGVFISLGSNIMLEVNSRLANITNTDELQENLFRDLETVFRENNQNKQNKFLSLKERIKYITENYPKSHIKEDTLKINYPNLGLKTLSEMNYILAQDNAGPKFSSIIQIKMNEAGSALLLNGRYPLSFYQAPGLNKDYKPIVKTAVEHLFNQFICMSFAAKEAYPWEISGTVKYRGYLYHNLSVPATAKWAALWQELKQEGALYFYPSSIDILENEIVVHGLIYILKDEQMNFYHFGEVAARFSDFQNLSRINIELNFYPFLSRVGVSGFKEWQNILQSN